MHFIAAETITGTKAADAPLGRPLLSLQPSERSISAGERAQPIHETRTRHQKYRGQR